MSSARSITSFLSSPCHSWSFILMLRSMFIVAWWVQSCWSESMLVSTLNTLNCWIWTRDRNDQFSKQAEVGVYSSFLYLKILGHNSYAVELSKSGRYATAKISPLFHNLDVVELRCIQNVLKIGINLFDFRNAIPLLALPVNWVEPLHYL